MSIIVLIYHQTPSRSAESKWDVPMSAFREQIDRLIDCGMKFVRFCDCTSEHYLSSGTWFCVTFDDGHKSNLDAFEFLESRKIIPAAFIVSDWSTNDVDFISAAELAPLSKVCDFGAHGATHTGLTLLSELGLRNELTSSKRYLETALGIPVESMALPGGRFNNSVLVTAKECGYKFIGNSVPLRNVDVSSSINRVTVDNKVTTAQLVHLGLAGELFWLAQKAKRTITSKMVELLGADRYAVISSQVKRVLKIQE